MARARYVMVGGFLGAGKTTAMLRLGERLASTGVRVGLVTNDQSSGLADTTILSAAGFPVEEITGGCFFCRFHSLTDPAQRAGPPPGAAGLPAGAGRRRAGPPGPPARPPRRGHAD